MDETAFTEAPPSKVGMVTEPLGIDKILEEVPELGEPGDPADPADPADSADSADSGDPGDPGVKVL